MFDFCRKSEISAKVSTKKLTWIVEGPDRDALDDTGEWIQSFDLGDFWYEGICIRAWNQSSLEYRVQHRRGVRLLIEL